MKPRPPGMSRTTYVRGYVRFGTARLLNLARGKWYFRHARSVGKNLIVRGRPLISSRNVVIGDNVTIISTHRRTHFTGDGLIELKDNSIINSGAMLMCAESIIIGEGAGIGADSILVDSNLHPIGMDPIHTAPVVIGTGAWVGMRAMIMPGVRVGSRALIAAASVVTASVPDDALVAGIPGRVIRILEYPEGQTVAFQRQGGEGSAATVWQDARARGQGAQGHPSEADPEVS